MSEIIRVISQIGQWIAEIPNNTIKLFSVFGDIFGFIGDFKDYIVDGINSMIPQTRAVNGTMFLASTIIYFVIVGMIFIVFDLIRDVV